MTSTATVMGSAAKTAEANATCFLYTALDCLTTHASLDLPSLSQKRDRYMTDEADINPAELAELTADIVSAFVSKNSVPVAGLPELITSVHSSLSGLVQPAAAPAAPLVPAVNPKKSIFPDYIISLEDGRKYKSMKRHLGASHGLTPDEYRAKWNLPADYPMVAPNYSAARSAMAKVSGLGRKTPPVKPPAKRKAK